MTLRKKRKTSHATPPFSSPQRLNLVTPPDRLTQPRVGITIGDPAGIGAEIVLKSVADARLGSVCRAVLLADADELCRQARHLRLPCEYPVVTERELAETPSADIVICDVGGGDNTGDNSGDDAERQPIAYGKLSAAAGRAAIRFIEAGVRLCLAKELAALVTAPINKESLKLAGSPFPGHTEMLAALCQSPQSLMAFFAGNLRVVLLTVHLSLADAIRAITRERVIGVIEMTHRELQRFGIAAPRLAVCGLNPHAGENGLFGSEELAIINPAIEHCREALGISVRGALPADTLFARAQRSGEFDCVIACYHDQGLVAVKSMAFGEAVNVTLGLPIIRTSVDHGTAFDIAGRGIAEPQSMTEAIRLAAQLAVCSSPVG